MEVYQNIQVAFNSYYLEGRAAHLTACKSPLKTLANLNYLIIKTKTTVSAEY